MSDTPADPKAPGLGTAGDLAEVLALAGCEDLAELADVLESCGHRDLPLRKVFEHVRTIELEGDCTLAEAAVHVEAIGSFAEHAALIDTIKGSAHVDDLDDLRFHLDAMRKHVESISDAVEILDYLDKIAGCTDEDLMRIECTLEAFDEMADALGPDVGGAIARAFYRAKLLIDPRDVRGACFQIAALPDLFLKRA